MTEKMKMKRQHLKDLSNGLSILKKQGAIDTINEGLCNIYQEQGHDTLRTYNSWQHEGYQVKRGESALLLWARPVHVKQDESDDDYQYFPIAFVFSNKQVYKVQDEPEEAAKVVPIEKKKRNGRKEKAA